MAIRTKIAIALSIVTASVLSIASSASAQTDVSPEDGLTQTIEAENAAAAVLIKSDDEGNVRDVSAAASFGEKGAAAIALPEYAGAVGAAVANGGISLGNYYGSDSTGEGAGYSGVVGFSDEPLFEHDHSRKWEVLE